ILGVDALILGTLTRLDVGNKGGISIGPVSVSAIKAEVVLTGRVVDASTAEIKDSFEGTGEASDASFSVSDLKGLSFGSNAFSGSVLGQSIQDAVNQFTGNIISDPESLLKGGTEIRGRVVKVIANRLIIDIGSQEDVREKMLGQLIRFIEVEGLDEDVAFPIGDVQVYSVNDTTAILNILSSEEAPQEGDFVVLSSSR
ncbi:MAG: CsgG/HfaB family protein, partial [Halanaerobiales bacterium]